MIGDSLITVKDQLKIKSNEKFVIEGAHLSISSERADSSLYVLEHKFPIQYHKLLLKVLCVVQTKGWIGCLRNKSLKSYQAFGKSCRDSIRAS